MRLIIWRVPYIYIVLNAYSWNGGGCTRWVRVEEKQTNRRSSAARAVFDAARRLQRTIVGENRARSFFRAGWLMALFASGRAGADDGRTVARAQVLYKSRAPGRVPRRGRARRAHVMRVKPLARRNPAAAAAHNHTAHYVRRPHTRRFTASTTRSNHHP